MDISFKAFGREGLPLYRGSAEIASINKLLTVINKLYTSDIFNCINYIGSI